MRRAQPRQETKGIPKKGGGGFVVAMVSCQGDPPKDAKGNDGAS